MDRTRVRSSHISSIGYDAASTTLEVQFKDGGLYQYRNVPESTYQGLIPDLAQKIAKVGVLIGYPSVGVRRQPTHDRRSCGRG